jgi:hypothetical protein
MSETRRIKIKKEVNSVILIALSRKTALKDF